MIADLSKLLYGSSIRIVGLSKSSFEFQVTVFQDSVELKAAREVYPSINCIILHNPIIEELEVSEYLVGNEMELYKPMYVVKHQKNKVTPAHKLLEFDGILVEPAAWIGVTVLYTDYEIVSDEKV